MEIRQKVVELIRRFKTDDPFRIAELKNIHIVYGDLGGKFGNYIKYKRSKFIILDNKKNSGIYAPFCMRS